MPVFFEKIINPQLRIAVWDIKETIEDLLELLPPLQNKEKTFLERISFAPRKKEWLASRVLIFHQTGIYPASRYKDNGQPFLTGSNEKISISHTRGFAAISLSTGQMPGIDIEHPSPRIEKVSDRFLHPRESHFLSSGTMKIRQLGLIWCIKEAVFKKCGTPGLNFKDQILSHPFSPESNEGKITASVIANTKYQKTIHLQYLIGQDFYLAWTI